MLVKYINYKQAYKKIIGNSFHNKPIIWEKLMYAIDLYNRNLFEKAFKKFNKLLKKCSTNEEYGVVYFFMALNLENGGYLDSARYYYEKAIEHDSTKASYYNNLGLNYQNNGDFDKALNAYERAVAIDKDYEMGYHNLGALYYKKAENDKAIENCLKALELKPNFFKSAEIVCAIYYIEQKNDLSKKYYQIAITNGSTKDRIKKILNEYRKIEIYGQDEFFGQD